MTSMHSRNVQHSLNFSDLSHFLLTTKITNLLKDSETRNYIFRRIRSISCSSEYRQPCTRGDQWECKGKETNGVLGAEL